MLRADLQRHLEVFARGGDAIAIDHLDRAVE
jgi:hypothetical protein